MTATPEFEKFTECVTDISSVSEREMFVIGFRLRACSVSLHARLACKKAKQIAVFNPMYGKKAAILSMICSPSGDWLHTILCRLLYRASESNA